MAIITVAPTNTACQHITGTSKCNRIYNNKLNILVVVGGPLLFLSFAPIAQEQEPPQPSHQFTPAIEISSHAYQIRSPQFNGTDNGAALDIIPSATWLYTGPNQLTQFTVEHQRVWYQDAQRSSYSLNEYDFTNQLRAFNQQLIWTVDASRGHMVRSGGEGGAGIFRDRITNLQGLSQTDRQGTSLQLSNALHRQAQFALNVSARRVDSEQPEEDDLLGDIENRQFRASFTTSRQFRYGGLYWRGNADASRTERLESTDFESESAMLQLGMPIGAGFGIIVKGNYEENSVRNSNFSNRFSSTGAGLEWNFGKSSRVNVTYNKVLNGPEQADYLATDFYLAPSRRTSLSGYWDKRYFGHTAQLSGKYNLRFLTMRLEYNDDVTTRSFLDTELTDLGLFVCPGGTTDIGSCTTMPRADYRPLPGQQILQFTELDSSISDDVVFTRRGVFALGYNRNRLTTGLELSSSELRYQETDRVDRRHTANLQNSLQITSVSRLSLNMKAFDYSFGSTDREDRNWLYELGWNRELSSASELSITARHSRRDSNDSNFDYRENRLSVTYKYQF